MMSSNSITLTEVAEGTWCWAVVAMHAGRRVRLKAWVDPHQHIHYDAIGKTYRYGNQNQYHVPTTLFDGWELYELPAPPEAIVVYPGSFMWAVAKAHLSPVAIRSSDSPEFKMDGGVLTPCGPLLLKESMLTPHEVMGLWSHKIDKEWKISTHTPPTEAATDGITI